MWRIFLSLISEWRSRKMQIFRRPRIMKQRLFLGFPVWVGQIYFVGCCYYIKDHRYFFHLNFFFKCFNLLSRLIHICLLLHLLTIDVIENFRLSGMELFFISRIGIQNSSHGVEMCWLESGSRVKKKKRRYPYAKYLL